MTTNRRRPLRLTGSTSPVRRSRLTIARKNSGYAVTCHPQAVSHAALRSLLPSGDGRSRCVDVAGGSSADSLRLQRYGCHGGANQRFELRNM